MANQPIRRMTTYPFSLWFILGLLLLLLIAAESFAIYTVFTSKFSGGNDFFVRWLGGREYLLHGTNPFDQSVAEKAQRAMFGRLTQAGDNIHGYDDQAYFAYPLYTLYFFGPLSLLPYAWAQAIWMTLLQFMMLAVTVLSIWLARWKPPTWLFLLTIFWGIFFYNSARAIILGQFSILVGLALLLALWSIENRHDWRAGLLLSVTTIKPQMVFLVVVFLLLWAWRHRRWGIMAGFGASMLFLVSTSMLLVPTWPLDFVNNVIAYSDYVGHGTPLQNLLSYLLPEAIADPLTVGVSILLFIALLPGWWTAMDLKSWLNRHKDIDKEDRSEIDAAFTWVIMLTLIVSSLITFRSATTNQIILYLPLFFFFRRLTLTVLDEKKKAEYRRANGAIVLIELGLMIFMWGVFAATIEGNWEPVMMHGLLPALLLLLYLIDWRGLRRAANLESV